MTRKIWFRPVLAAVGLVILGVAACTAPTEYEVEVGKQMSIAFADPGKSLPDLEAQIAEVQAYIDGLEAVDGCWFNIQARPDGPVNAEITMWGQRLDGEALRADLLARFPFLNDAEIAFTPLAGATHGTFADRLGHDLFHVEVSGGTAEEIRMQILEELTRQQLSGDADVEVTDGPDGRRQVRIEIKDVQGEE